jgi:hypothetical protein
MWTIGLAVSGNEVGLSRPDWQALPEDEQRVRRERACRRLLQSGAHYVVDTIADSHAVHRRHRSAPAPRRTALMRQRHEWVLRR